MRALGGGEQKELKAALMEAFPTPEDLEMLLRLGLGISLAAAAPTGKKYEFVVFSVIQASEAEGWTAELILAACAARPRSTRLAAIAEPLGVVAVAGAELELMVRPRTGIHDVEWWRETLRRSERRVCRLDGETPAATVSGTAFLVGPDLLLTNFHVVEPLLLSTGPVAVSARFDVRLGLDGGSVSKGERYALTDRWPLACSPHNDAKKQSIAAAGSESPHLDYALLQLAASPGEDEIGLDGDGDKRRGWVHLDADTQSPVLDDQVLILQHPGDAPLQIALGNVVDAEEGQPVVRYLANTDRGSSGAPCFSAGWDLVALHQGGAAGAGANQGIAARAIAEHINGKLGAGTLREPVESA